MTITGTLALENYDDLYLEVETLLIASSGSIQYSKDICGTANAPNVTITASGSVTLDGPIELDGGHGTAALDTAECNSCYGGNGGDVSILGAEIEVNAGISTRGGDGSVLTIVVGSDSVRTGCSGGDGGNITIEASGSLSIGGSLESDGGDGGSALYGDGANGASGAWAVQGSPMSWTVAEREPNYSPTSATQVVPYLPGIVFTGSIQEQEDAPTCEPAGVCWQINFPNGTVDMLEDMFVLDVRESTTVSLSFAATWGDMDIYLLSTSGTTIVAEANTAATAETLTQYVSAGRYLVALSFADDYGLTCTVGGGGLCPNPYTVTFGP